MMFGQMNVGRKKARVFSCVRYAVHNVDLSCEMFSKTSGPGRFLGITVSQRWSMMASESDSESFVKNPLETFIFMWLVKHRVSTPFP